MKAPEYVQGTPEYNEIKSMMNIMHDNHKNQLDIFVKKQQAYSTRAIKEFGMKTILLRPFASMMFGLKLPF